MGAKNQADLVTLTERFSNEVLKSLTKKRLS